MKISRHKYLLAKNFPINYDPIFPQPLAAWPISLVPIDRELASIVAYYPTQIRSSLTNERNRHFRSSSKLISCKRNNNTSQTLTRRWYCWNAVSKSVPSSEDDEASITISILSIFTSYTGPKWRAKNTRCMRAYTNDWEWRCYSKACSQDSWSTKLPSSSAWLHNKNLNVGINSHHCTNNLLKTTISRRKC